MKIKSALAAAAVMAAVSCVSVNAFAESVTPNLTAAESGTSTTSAEISATSTETSATSSDTSVTSATEAADPMEGNNPGTGVTGAAVIFGMVAVAGAALVISHKHE